MESSTSSTLFVFCKSCGLQRVCDVAEELQRLFWERQMDPNTCGICCKQLKETNNGTDIHPKLEQDTCIVSSAGTSKLRQSDANDQSDSDTENYALTAEDHIQPSDNVEPDDVATQGGDCIKEEMLDDTVIIHLKREASSEEQAEPVKKLKGIYQKKKIARGKKPVKIVSPEVVQTSTDEPYEIQPQRRSARLRKGTVLQARQYTNPQNDEVFSDDEELGDFASETDSKESSETEQEDESIKDDSEELQGDELKEEPEEGGQGDGPDKKMKAVVQKLMQMKEDPQILAQVQTVLEEVGKHPHEFLVPELLEYTEPSDDPARPVQCKVCKSKFMATGRFLKHLTRHTGKPPMEKPLKCTECGLTFAVPKYKNHACKQRFKYAQKCIYKGCYRYRFWDKSAFISHVDVHRGVKGFICSNSSCGKGFISMKDLLNHRPTHLKKNKPACHICNRQFPNRGQLNRHNIDAHKIHKPTSSVECDKCGRRFISGNHLQVHKKWHKKQPSNRKKYCGICNESFTRQSALDKHLKLQKCKNPKPGDFEAATKYVDPVLKGFADMPCKKDKLFRCEICSKKSAEFLHARGFLAHMKSAHPIVDCPVTHAYRCDQCSKKFLKRCDVMNHVLTHSSIKPFKCDFENCFAAFRTLSSMKLHQVTHRDLKDRLKHICHICGSALSTVSKLNEHVRTVHAPKDQPRPCICSICNQGFFYIGKLREHEKKRHLNVRAYVCEVCGKSYKNSHELRSHKYIHTGERPFACKFCDYRCTKSAYLQKHVRIHTGERPYVCDLCGMRFLDKTRLNTHNKTKHKTMSMPKSQTVEVLTKSDAEPQIGSSKMPVNQSEATATFVPLSSEPREAWQVHGETSNASERTSNATCPLPRPLPLQSEVELACQNIAVQSAEGVMGGTQVQNFIQMLE